MPWKESSTMDERLRFLIGYESGTYQMAELSRRYGISRQCGYKWWQRYVEEGVEGIKEQSRAPGRCPHRVAPELVQELVRERKRYGYGGKKIIARLRENRPEESWPSAATADKYFQRYGLTQPGRRRRRRGAATRPEVNATDPNQLWTADFKGEFRLGNGQYCYPLTVVDSHSRYLLGCRGLTSTRGQGAKQSFERVFAE